MIYFLDTSALVKRYIAETGSEQVRRLLRRGVEIPTARMTEAEAYAAIARATRMKVLTIDERNRVFDQLAEDLEAARI
jgi:predicted nucleic acid-binding protein